MNKTKSGQSTDELYAPTGCIFKVSQFRNLWWSRQAVEQIPRWNWVHRSKNYLGSKKNSLAETKIKLLAKCTNAIKNSALIESQGIRHSSFATYVEEKFSSLNKCQITIAEKRINDVLFELEMSVGNESIDWNIKPFQNVPSF